MTYVDYEYYKTLYGDKSVEKINFDRLSYDASRKIDNETTGVDGVRKLRVAFPLDEEDAEAVKRCVCKMIEIANDIESAKTQMSIAHGYVQRADGTMVSKTISSVSAGNETISYYNGNGNLSIIEKAAMNPKEEIGLYKSVIREYLSGVSDANGVNLLYAGRYPV